MYREKATFDGAEEGSVELIAVSLQKKGINKSKNQKSTFCDNRRTKCA